MYIHTRIYIFSLMLCEKAMKVLRMFVIFQTFQVIAAAVT